jgi:putative transposase
MRINALRARPKRRGKPKDDGERSVIADNILDRDFQADRPNQKWPADFTYIWTAEGWLYVAAVLDLYSRRAVGWSMKAERDASLVMDALMMAVWRRGPRLTRCFIIRTRARNTPVSSFSACWRTTAPPAR